MPQFRHVAFAGGAVLLAGALAFVPSAVEADSTPSAGAASTSTATPVIPAGVPDGRDVTAAGVTVNVACEGSGGPTVVLLAGVGADSDDVWDEVMPAVAGHNRVCAVDRAGVGDSPERTKLTNGPAQNAAEVLAGLQAAGEQGPYLFTGWSYGGLVALTAAEDASQTKIPSQSLAGVVLVDGSLPDEYRTIDPTPWVEAGETLDMAEAEPEIAKLNMGSLPLVVLEAGKPLPNPAAEAYKRAGMARMADLSGNSVVATVPGSPHNIADHSPAAVIDAIASATASFNSGSRLQACPKDFQGLGLVCRA